MFFKKEVGSRAATMKIEVDYMKIPLFNLLSMIYEIDLYPLWFPFCKSVKQISQPSKARKLAAIELMLPFPLHNRFDCLYGVGINRLKTNGSLIVVVKSIELLDEAKILPIFTNENLEKKNKSLVNMLTYFYGHEIIPISKTEIRMRSIFKVDP